MIEVNILGPAEIRKANGELEQSFLTGPKRLALLVYLLLKKPYGFHRRDSLLPLFWPEMGQKNARNSLSNILYHIRKTFGNDSVINRGGEEIRINRDLFDCDVNIFETLIKGKKIKALDLYRGDLLKGFYVSQTSSDFEFWLENERQRLKERSGKLILSHIKDLINSGNLEELEVAIQRSMEFNLPEESDCLEWVNALVSRGENQMAQSIYKDFCQNYLAEFEESPSTEFTKKIKEIHNSNLYGNGDLNGKLSSQKSLENRIAVLPFESIGPDQESTLTEAIHSDILTNLSGLPGLHVISRTSVLGYRGTQVPAPQIANQLKINWILTGEVIQLGSNIKVNVRLIKAEVDRQVWSESYLQHLNMDNLFKIQSEITQKITDSLRLRLHSVKKQKEINTSAENLESYCLCAQARWYFDQRTEAGIRKAIALFRQALKEDQNYALAWVGLADSLILLQDYGYVPHDEVIQEAEIAAKKAYKLDPGFAETHATLGLLLADKREVSKALGKLKDAIRLSPSYSDAYNWIGWFSNVTGDPENALLNSRKAVELNPLSPEAISNLALSHLSNGNYEAAIRQARQIQILNPEWTTSYFYEALGLFHIEEFEKTKMTLKDLVVDWAGNAVNNVLAMIAFKEGSHQKFLEMQEEFGQQQDHFGSALTHILLNDHAKTLQELKKIKFWNYWNSIALFNLFKSEFKTLEKDPEFLKIKGEATASWGI